MLAVLGRMTLLGDLVRLGRFEIRGRWGSDDLVVVGDWGGRGVRIYVEGVQC